MSKIDFEHVKKAFEENKCVLMESEFVGHNVPMKYRCDCGRITFVRWGNFKKRMGRSCSGRHKLDFEYVKNQFEKRGCVLLETKFEGCSFPMKYVCSCGNNHQMSWDNFKAGHNCNKCGYDSMRGKNSHLWNPDRRSVAINEKIRKKYYHMLRSTLVAARCNKDCKSAELLGYTSLELREHLENHPNWEKCGEDWHLDHVFPIKAFVDHGVYDIKIINCLENLCPINKQENLLKGCNYSKQEFLQWLFEKGVHLAT